MGTGQDVRIIDDMPVGVYLISMDVKNNNDSIFAVAAEGAESEWERLVWEPYTTDWSGTDLLRIGGNSIFSIPPGTILITVDAEPHARWEIVITEI